MNVEVQVRKRSDDEDRLLAGVSAAEVELQAGALTVDDSDTAGEDTPVSV